MHKARKEKFSQAFKGFIQGDMKYGKMDTI